MASDSAPVSKYCAAHTDGVLAPLPLMPAGPAYSVVPSSSGPSVDAASPRFWVPPFSEKAVAKHSLGTAMIGLLKLTLICATPAPAPAVAAAAGVVLTAASVAASATAPRDTRRLLAPMAITLPSLSFPGV